MADSGEGGRVRFTERYKNRITTHEEFINPYPWMSSIDARVALYLEDKGVPYSYRYFDGDSVHLRFFMPDYHPEFTLREYKIVIVVLGNYFSDVPGIIDRQALAMTLLQQDGWKTIVLFEDEVLTRLAEAIEEEAPELRAPTIKGRPRVSPWGLPDFMEKRIAFLRALALRRKTNFFDPERKVFSRDRFSIRRPLRIRGSRRTRFRVRG